MTTPTPIPITLLGSTGLTGNATLHTLLMSAKQPFDITTFSRSAPTVPIAISKETTHTSKTYADLFEAVKEQVGTKGGVYATCLGTTRAQAGSFDNQRRIDLDLNRDLAKKAREDGCTTVCILQGLMALRCASSWAHTRRGARADGLGSEGVDVEDHIPSIYKATLTRKGILLSSGMGNSSSYAPYLKMKGELEDEFKQMGFERTIILKPGLLMGERNETRTAEWATQKIFRGLGAVGLPMKSLMIEAHEVGECIAYFASHPVPAGTLVLSNGEMVEYARKWREGTQ